MIDFLGIVNSSIAWTKTILFKPFNWKKWLILGFVALLSGSLSSGSFNLNLPSSKGKNNKGISASSGTTALSVSPSQPEKLNDKKNSPDIKTAIIQIRNILRQPAALPWLIGGALLILLFLGFFSWLHARFSFVFLEDVLKNDASVRGPFSSTKEIGDSFFGYSFGFSALFTALFSSLFVFLLRDVLRVTVFSPGGIVSPLKVLSAVLPYLAVILPAAIFVVLLWVFILDIVLVVMYKDKSKFGPAFFTSLKIISGNKKNFIAYILAKFVLGIAAGVIYMFIALASIIILLIPVLLVAGLIYLIALISKAAAVIFVIAVVIPAGLFLGYCMLCLGLPVAVFFRTFSVKFIGSIDRRYDLLGAQGEASPKTQSHSPELAATLSFIIAGLGQFYNGQVGKGIVIFITSWLIFPWVIGIIDAYNTAKRIKDEAMPVKKSVGCMVVFVSGVFLFFVAVVMAIFLAAVITPYFLASRAKPEIKKTVTETERR